MTAGMILAGKAVVVARESRPSRRSIHTRLGKCPQPSAGRYLKTRRAASSKGMGDTIVQ